jgi:hypothetical protein
MLQAHARALLGLIGKSDEQGIIEPADMPAVLATLRGVPDALPEPSSSQAADTPPAGRADPDDVPAFADEPVSLRKRAWPLIQMIERAQAAGKPVVWGV